jgi:hypothetical protein
MDLRRKQDREAVAQLYAQLRNQQLRSAYELFKSLWQSDQDLKDIELLSLLSPHEEVME